MSALIDYKVLVAAQNFYGWNSFINVEVPWLVNDAVSAVTRPPDRRGCIVSAFNNDHLIASGEQGFISMFGRIKPGLYQTTTPCFRDEPVIDKWHKRYFMKLELISICPKDPEGDLEYVINKAGEFFVANGIAGVKPVRTEEGYDIVSKDGIELGSYGIRITPDGKTLWVYGTGVALPRFSQVRGI